MARGALVAGLGAVLAVAPGQAGEIHDAVIAADVERINGLIARGDFVDAPGPDGLSPLTLAAREGHAEVIGVLLAAGANPRGKWGFHRATALHLAALNHQLQAAQLLIAAGADLDALASIQVRNPTRWPPLMHTVVAPGGQLDYRTGVRLPAGTGDVIAPGLLATGRGEDRVAADRLAMAQLLLRHGADVEAGGCGERAILLAVAQGDSEMVDLLLAHGANPDTGNLLGRRILDLAFDLGHGKIADRLRAVGGRRQDEISGPETALHVAARRDRVAEVDRLIATGAEVNARDRMESTPLIEAASRAHEETLALLVAAGADLEAETVSCSRALHRAVEARGDEAVAVLTAAGAQLNVRDRRGATPLHLAIERRAPDIAGLLMRYGADLRLADYSGRTPRELAAEAGEDFAFLLAEPRARQGGG